MLKKCYTTSIRKVLDNNKPKQPTNKPITKQSAIQTNKQSDTNSDSDDDDQIILWFNIPNATITHNIPTINGSHTNTSVETAYETITDNLSDITNTSSETLAPYLNNRNENNEDEQLTNVIDINENDANKVMKIFNSIMK